MMKTGVRMFFYLPPPVLVFSSRWNDFCKRDDDGNCELDIAEQNGDGDGNDVTQCNAFLEDDELNMYIDDGRGNDGVGDDVVHGDGDGEGDGDGYNVTQGNALPEDHP